MDDKDDVGHSGVHVTFPIELDFSPRLASNRIQVRVLGYRVTRDSHLFLDIPGGIG